MDPSAGPDRVDFLMEAHFDRFTYMAAFDKDDAGADRYLCDFARRKEVEELFDRTMAAADSNNTASMASQLKA